MSRWRMPWPWAYASASAFRARRSRHRRRLRGARLAQLPQLLQDRVETLTLDELHHIVVRSLLFADSEHGHDVGVMQPRGGASLALETAHLLGVNQRTGRQDFEGHAAAQRLLF